jgi:hypothetical protein
MPNGSHDFGERLEILEPFFASISDKLNEFASKHELLLERYYHESPSWRFSFRHPRRGVGCVEVMRVFDDSIKVYIYWWLDDYDQFARFIKRDETPEYVVGEVNLVELLDEQLRTVLSWDPGVWTQVATGYERYWRPMGKVWIERNDERYPVPKA